jgi:hypothetical protein
VSAANRIGLVVDVLCRMFRMNDEMVDIVRTETEDARFPMIDPDNRVEMVLVHSSIPSSRVV